MERKGWWSVKAMVPQFLVGHLMTLLKKRDLAVVCCKHKVSVAAPLQNEKKEGKK